MRIRMESALLTVIVLLTSCGVAAPEPSNDIQDYPKDGTRLPNPITLDAARYDSLMGSEGLGRFVVSAASGLFFRDPQDPVNAITYSTPGRSQGARGVLGFGTFVAGVGYADAGQKWMLVYRADDESDHPAIGLVYKTLVRKVGDQETQGSQLGSSGGSDLAKSDSATGYYFPIAKRPPDFASHTSRGLYFASPRPGTSRVHAACDLWMPSGTPVYAIADGVVLDYRAFYSGTDALQVRHKDVVVRYGEVKGLGRGVKVGGKVKAGQLIAYVGGVRSGSAMLHFELYDGRATGSLSTSGVKNYPLLKSPLNRKQFDRNRYLLDATDHLLRSIGNLPGKN